MSHHKYSHLSKSELLELISKLENGKKYGLVWEESSPEKVVLDCEKLTPILQLEEEKKIITSAEDINHVLIEGDNYHALKVLSYTHQVKIDLIYIDPPYNTGKSDEFLYNDKYVDLDDEYRHSKWLSFIHKRMKLAKDLLSETGVIFIAIDDNEIAQLKLLCNQLFGEANFVAQFVRKNKVGSGHDSSQIAVEYDYMLCFAKNKSKLEFAKETLDVANDKKYKLKDAHVARRGKYYLRDLDYKGSYSKSMDYAITTPDQTKIYSGGKFGKPNTWRWNKEKFEWGIENDFIVFKKNKDQWKVYIKQYQYVDNKDAIRIRKLPYRGLIKFLNSQGSQELNNMLKQRIFKFPKSTELLEFCINLLPQKDITVLDFFAGSGTTGHAVLKANKKDGGKRQFILCTNNENSICQDVTYPRIEKAIHGYTNAKGKKIESLGGNLLHFTTAFAEEASTKNLLSSCASILCLKEGVFNLKLATKEFFIFEKDEQILAIHFGLNKNSLEKLKNNLNQLKHKKTLYIFAEPELISKEINIIEWTNTELKALPIELSIIYPKLIRHEKKQSK